MDNRLEIMCENIRDGHTEGITIIGPTGSKKNYYAKEICKKLCRSYRLLSLTAYSSSLNELYDAVENGDILIIEGIEFVDDQLLHKIYEILFLILPGQKFLVPTAPGAEILFGTKPIYITKYENFKCILLLNSRYISLLKKMRPMDYLLIISHHFPILQLPAVERDRENMKGGD